MDDHWWHIAAGRDILATGRILDYDQFSFTYYGHEWINIEWLYDVYIAWIWNNFGLSGLYGSRLIIFYLMSILIFLGHRYAIKDVLTGWNREAFALVSTLFVLVILQFRISDRPHSMAYLMIALFMFMIPRLLPNFPLIMSILSIAGIVLWRNCHPSWVLGVVIYFIFTVEYFISEIKSKGSVGRRYYLFIPGCFFLLAAGITASPHKFDFGLYLSHNSMKSNLIAEWVPFHQAFIFSPHMIIFLIYSAVFVFLLLLLFKRNPLLAVFSVVLLVQAFLHVRYLSELIIISGAMVAVIIAQEIKKFKIEMTRRKQISYFIIFFLFCNILFVSNSILFPVRPFGYGINSKTNPVGAMDFIEKSGLEGNLISTNTSVGGYVTFRLWPKVKTFIDGRILTLFPEDFLERFSNHPSDAVQGFKIDFVLYGDKLLNYNPESLESYYLIYFGETSALFASESLLAAHPEIKRFNLLTPWKLIKPGYIDWIKNNGKQAELFDEFVYLKKIAPDDKLTEAISETIGYIENQQ